MKQKRKPRKINRSAIKTVAIGNIIISKMTSNTSLFFGLWIIGGNESSAV